MDPGSSPRFRGGTAGEDDSYECAGLFPHPAALGLSTAPAQTLGRAAGPRIWRLRRVPSPNGSSSSSAKSYRAPQENRTTPGRTASVTDAPAKQAPRALKTRTTSPSPMPQLRASTGLIANVSRPAILPRALTGPASIWLCRRWRGWLEIRCSGNAAVCPPPSHSADPSRTPRAVIISEAGNLVGIDLDPPGGSAQRVVFWIGAELGEQHVFLRSRWDFDPAFLPERIEVRHQVALRALAEGAVEVAQPMGLVPPLGEALLAAETPRQIAENVEVVARVANGFDRLVHRDDEPVAR